MVQPYRSAYEEQDRRNVEETRLSKLETLAADATMWRRFTLVFALLVTGGIATIGLAYETTVMRMSLTCHDEIVVNPTNGTDSLSKVTCIDPRQRANVLQLQNAIVVRCNCQ